jgi:glutaryl-CoA dehydrogenase
VNLVPPDFLSLEDTLTDEERAIRDGTRRFAAEHVAPDIARAWREGRALTHLFPLLGAQGMLGAGIDGYGCAGLAPRAYGLMMKELERQDSCVRSMVGVQSNLVMVPIAEMGSDAQRERWLPVLRRGEAIGCFALSEPDAGSDPGAMKTRATKVDGGYVLRGTKRWITNGTLADIALVWAQTGEGLKDIRAFLVDTRAKGFTAAKVGEKQSFRASDTAELHFDDVFVSDDDMLPLAQGLKSALHVLNQARFGIAWGVLGAAEACLAVAIDFAKERVAFGRAIAGFQLVQKKLVDAAGDIAKAELVARDLAEKKANGTMRSEHVSFAKMNNVDAALSVARVARDVLGANGIMDDYPVMRHLCNLETVYTYEGTHDVHLLVVGHALTGASAFRG